jgi:hypothetical protein
VQWDLECARHLKEVNKLRSDAKGGDLIDERHSCAVDDVTMPSGLYESDSV